MKKRNQLLNRLVNHLRRLSLGFQTLAILLLAGCATTPVLTPEITNSGSIATHGGIVYAIPPTDQPVLNMKLVSLGLNSKKMLHVRMYFDRRGTPAGEYLDPREQFVVFPDSVKEVYPVQIHANAKDRPIISLVDPPRQLVELIFPLPEGGHDFPSVELHWKVHYRVDGKDQVMAKTQRYDLVDKYAQSGVGNYSGDGEFPESEPWLMPEYSDWIGSGWMWW